jgi:non-canonical purine NTP pyrophosphatase (RdgB/HAM1 family)
MAEPPVTAKGSYGIEVQGDTVEEVCRFKALSAMQALKTAVIVDDTGFFVDSLRGFPGPYAKYVNMTIGASGLVALLGGAHDRAARMVSCVGYCDPNGETHLFTHTMAGTLAYIPAFVPDNAWRETLFFSIFTPAGHDRTLGEMLPTDIVRLRDYPLRNAVEGFVRWITTRAD